MCDHQEEIIKKNSYERRDYESVDEKKPILGYVLKNDKKLVLKGLKKMKIYQFALPFSAQEVIII